MIPEPSTNQDADAFRDEREMRERLFNAVIDRNHPLLASLLASAPFPKEHDGDLLGVCARIGWGAGLELLAPFCNVPISRALAHCAGQGDEKSVKMLLSFFLPADDRDEAIRLASERGRVECLRLLLSWPLPEGSRLPLCALRGAASEGHAPCVELLLPLFGGAQLDAIALQLAADNGQSECVKLLLPFSDASDSSFRALRSAVQMGHIECVEMLLAARPIPLDPSLKFPRPPDFLACAIGSGCPQMISLVLRDPEFRALCDLSVFVNMALAEGRSDLADLLVSIIESDELSSMVPPILAKAPLPRL